MIDISQYRTQIGLFRQQIKFDKFEKSNKYNFRNPNNAPHYSQSCFIILCLILLSLSNLTSQFKNDTPRLSSIHPSFLQDGTQSQVILLDNKIPPHHACSCKNMMEMVYYKNTPYKKSTKYKKKL